jgi:hypothetical protein
MKLILQIMKSLKLYLLACALFFGQFTIQGQLLKNLEKMLPSNGNTFSNEEAAAGIREALINGTENSVNLVSAVDGYFGNPKIKIPFPPEAQQVEQKLRAFGLGSKVDEAIVTMNRAAENAAKDIQPIFVSAIKSMSISDAIGIVKGDDHAATEYLRKTTSDPLFIKIKPVVEKSLEEVDATRYWDDLINTYNAFPFVKKMNPDLAEYVTEKAISGLFVMVALEEEKIRKDPLARTSELLQKVFGN